MAIGPMGGMAIGGSLGNLAGGFANMFSGDSGRDELAQALLLLQQVQEPDFDFTQLTAPELQFIAQVDPELYSARVPDDVKIAAESGARGNEMLALAQMEDIAERGMPLADRLQSQDAVEAMANQSGSVQEAILQELAARGRLSGGDEIQARLEGDRSQNQLRSSLGRGLIQEALNRRLQAVGRAGEMAGAVRGKDLAREAANAEMINNMNRFVAAQETDAARWGAEQQNLNAMREAEGRQSVSDTNRIMDYEAAQGNVDRTNMLQQALADFRLRRAGAEAGALGAMAQSSQREGAARSGAIRDMTSGLGSAIGGLYGAGLLGGGGGGGDSGMDVWFDKGNSFYNKYRGAYK